MRMQLGRISLTEYRTSNSARLKKAHTKSAEVRRSFLRQCRDAGVEQPATEFQFHPTRKWKFDFCWIEKRIALESEGGLFSARGGHRTYTGIKRDMEKYNAAAKLGYRVFRFTPDEITNGTALHYFLEL